VTADVTALRTELDALSAELDALQGEKPLTRVCVDSHIVEEVIPDGRESPSARWCETKSQWFWIRIASWPASHRQSHALQQIRQRISTSRAGLDDPQKPVGVFLLIGPSGVGKTEQRSRWRTSSMVASGT